MSFCGKCGSELEPQVKFCGKCGQELSSNDQDISELNIDDKESKNTTNKEVDTINSNEEVVNNIRYEEKLNANNGESYKTILYKKNIIVISIIGIILLSFGTLWYIGNNITKPSKLVGNFDNAISANNKNDISNLIYCSDSKFQSSEKSVEPLLSYFKDNPSYSKNVIEALKKQALNIETNKNLISYINNTSSNTFNIIEDGKKFLFFPNYKIEIKPIYIQVSTGAKDVTFTLNNEEIGKSDSDKFTKEYGPFIPGKYELVSTYSGKYVSLNEKNNIDGISSSNEKIKVNVFDTLSYVKVSSDYPNAEIYVNNKETGVKVSDAQNFGPLSKGTTVYGVANKNGKTIKSAVYTVETNDTNIYLDFQKAESQIKDIENQLHGLIDNYTYYFGRGINYNSFSYVEPYLYPGSNIYNEQKDYIPKTYKNGIREEIKSFRIISYTLSDDNKSGTINTEEIYNIENNGKSSIQTFNYKYTFKYNDSKKYFQLDSIDTSSK